MNRRAVLAAVGVLVLILLVFYLGAAGAAPPPTCGPCDGAKPFCDTATGQCTACGSDAHCPSGTFCATSGACTACRNTGTGVNAITEGCPAGRYCLDGATCVECLADNSSTCAESLHGPICGPGNVCVNCRDGRDCTNSSLANYDEDAPLCDLVANACVGCVGDDDCTGSSTYCGAGGVCAACNPEAGTPGGGCPGGGYCISTSGGPACAPCVLNDEVRACPGGGYCIANGESSTCVECVADDKDRGCGEGFTCHGGQCLIACGSNPDCGADSSTPNCIDGVCVACSAADDCRDPLVPTCVNGLCVECTVSRDGVVTGCDGAAPYCYQNTCQQCSPSNRNADCDGNPQGGFCTQVDPENAYGSYQCAECVSDTYCEGRNLGKPFCDAGSLKCVACNDAHVTCGAGQSCAGGQCAECAVTEDCPEDSGRYCYEGQCVLCHDDGGCESGERCGTQGATQGTCVVCRGDFDCGAPTPHCRSDGLACDACAGDVDCSADATRPFCDVDGAGSGSYKCVGCRSGADCPGGRPCIGNVCACNTTCDCTEMNGLVDPLRYLMYCEQSGHTCRYPPSPGYGWQIWETSAPESPTDSVVGDADFIGAIALGKPGDQWSYGYTPRDPKGAYARYFGMVSGQSTGSTAKATYGKSWFSPQSGRYWYLAAFPGVRPGPLLVDDNGLFFNTVSPSADITTPGDTVCVNGPQSKFSTTHNGVCKYPSDPSFGGWTVANPFVRPVNDCGY